MRCHTSKCPLCQAMPANAGHAQQCQAMRLTMPDDERECWRGSRKATWVIPGHAQSSLSMPGHAKQPGRVLRQTFLTPAGRNVSHCLDQIYLGLLFKSGATLNFTERLVSRVNQFQVMPRPSLLSCVVVWMIPCQGWLCRVPLFQD